MSKYGGTYEKFEKYIRHNFNNQIYEWFVLYKYITTEFDKFLNEY